MQRGNPGCLPAVEGLAQNAVPVKLGPLLVGVRDVKRLGTIEGNDAVVVARIDGVGNGTCIVVAAYAHGLRPGVIDAVHVQRAGLLVPLRLHRVVVGPHSVGWER